ncbi:hypothetical protein C8R44DRAFT_141181 [Mycena epipterygia]|nr:hypothetical protein C8R44DRAFT_141181 [Mycena epipterygia]
MTSTRTLVWAGNVARTKLGRIRNSGMCGLATASSSGCVYHRRRKSTKARQRSSDSTPTVSSYNSTSKGAGDGKNTDRLVENMIDIMTLSSETTSLLEECKPTKPSSGTRDNRWSTGGGALYVFFDTIFSTFFRIQRRARPHQKA